MNQNTKSWFFTVINIGLNCVRHALSSFENAIQKCSMHLYYTKGRNKSHWKFYTSCIILYNVIGSECNENIYSHTLTLYTCTTISHWFKFSFTSTLYFKCSTEIGEGRILEKAFNGWIVCIVLVHSVGSCLTFLCWVLLCFIKCVCFKTNYTCKWFLCRTRKKKFNL